MIFSHARTAARTPVILMLFLLATFRLAAAPVGPTLHLDYGQGAGQTNEASQFMYFVPLIAPEPVFVLTNAGNTQCVRVSSSTCKISGEIFLATCDFEISGAGSQQNVLDHANLIRKHEKELKAGGTLTRQLSAIDVEGAGSGSVEIEGVVTNGIRSVNEVRLRFNARGKISPVFISLKDISYRAGAVQIDNEIIARVNTLTFRRAAGPAKMEVTLASLKRKDAGDTAWQNFLGSVKGMVANELIPPIPVETVGHQAMLDFGLALTAQKSTFTFPFATRLEPAPVAK